MIVHLLESTLLLALAILISHLPRVAARTRYAIVFAALVKFAIPSALVPRLLAFFDIDLARVPKGAILIETLGTLNTASLRATNTPIWPAVMLTLWLAIAAALLIRSLVRGNRAVGLALSHAIDADARELAALAQAGTRANVTSAVRLVRSPSMATPATVGILRPVIVIPAGMQLANTELETILTHECAHVARHDNLLGILESIAGCALWFHPLVWIARRALDAAREEACDAIVVSSGDASVYVTALGKVCDASIAPRTAAISCIVSNTIRERMETITRFGSRRFLPHRAVTATVIARQTVVTIGIGVAHALPAAVEKDTPPTRYQIETTATREGSDFLFTVVVRDHKSGEMSSWHFRSPVNEQITKVWESIDPDGTEHNTRLRATGHDDGTATVEAEIKGEPLFVQNIVVRPASVKTGNDTISINLKDADIHDVLRNFALLTKTEMIVDDGITGRVTLDVVDVPWTEAFDAVLKQNNLRYERINHTIHVHRN